MDEEGGGHNQFRPKMRILDFINTKSKCQLF